jgi:hypothetical protein
LRTARSIGFVVFCAIAAAAIAVPVARAQRRAPAMTDPRPAAQQKIDQNVLTEIYRRRGGQMRVGATPTRRVDLKIDRHGRALVDVRAPVRPALEKKVKALGGIIVSTSSTYDSIVGWVPLLTLERLAADPSVRVISPAGD